ncbi:PREDICTED: uncharacterized protein LOC105556051 [Vollenhovia emeryi]|uniref:uncharacterized protein LOC105556051 n=1 Tax=Vollenhovia emeryi TaxID=411798 RepID=UPI0005F46F05|nr:PREDICTED: uncharacterized protein LOC105556051 [Vollenhovia emeryi]
MSLAQRESFEGVEDSRISCLNAFKDKSGLIRLKTLVSNREDQFGFRCPIVLESRHPLVERLIQYRHKQLNHAGIQTVMNNLREQVWILSSRRAIRSVLSKCTICKRYKAKRIEASPSILPEERIRDATAFVVSGVDFAGPLYLKDGQKAWICLFTCAVYRAVHLELATSLSTEAFLEAFRRFVARRGRPSIMFSDNGTNFCEASNLLRSINWKKVAEYSTMKKIEWRFNPPSAAWWGGWWERLVRSVKEILRKVLGRACLTFEEMNTTLCDCEAIINSRPITYLSEDSDQLIPLTPAMFIQDVQEIGLPDLDHVQEGDLKARIRYRQKLRADLRRRFRSEYLGQLSRTSYSKNGKYTVRKGDVVLIGNENQKRLDWPLARVIEVIPGRDGEVRVVRPRVENSSVPFRDCTLWKSRHQSKWRH